MSYNLMYIIYGLQSIWNLIERLMSFCLCVPIKNNIWISVFCIHDFLKLKTLKIWEVKNADWN